jgi:hypothetical protein
MVRAVGADTYFAVWTFGMAASCKENQQWQNFSLAVWLVETLAVNTHYATGTVQGIPLLMFQLDIGSRSAQSHDSTGDVHMLGRRKIPTKQPEGKSLLSHTIAKAS